MKQGKYVRTNTQKKSAKFAFETKKYDTRDDFIIFFICNQREKKRKTYH